MPDVALPVYVETPVEAIESIHARLRKTWLSGKTRPVAFRREQLSKLYRGIVEQSPLIVESLARDFKGVFEAAMEVQVALKELANCLENLESWLSPVYMPKPIVLMVDTAKVIYEPYGVVLGISPWNFPFSIALTSAIGAIACGNCFVFKPSEISPNTSAILTQLVNVYLDPDCYAVINGDKDVTTKALELRWDFIAYTGSSLVGRTVMAAAAKHLIPVLLELGGKSPAIIDDLTCDLRIAVRRIVWARFFNAGQLCIAVDYVICRPQVKARLLELLREEIVAFYSRDPKTNPEWPKIISQRHAERIVANVPTDTSPPSHGRIVHGGSFDVKERFIEPTVLFEVDPHTAPIMQAEIFGPILPVIEMDLDAAIDYIRSKDRPLALYIFSDDEAVIEKITSQVPSGGVCINDTLMQHSLNSLPFGGVGESGMGACHGRHSIEQFSHKRAIYRANHYRHMDTLAKVRYPGSQLEDALPIFFPHNLYPRPPSPRFVDRTINLVISTLRLLYKAVFAKGEHLKLD